MELDVIVCGAPAESSRKWLRHFNFQHFYNKIAECIEQLKTDGDIIHGYSGGAAAIHSSGGRNDFSHALHKSGYEGRVELFGKELENICI